jgi:hypothetical protein
VLVTNTADSWYACGAQQLGTENSNILERDLLAQVFWTLVSFLQNKWRMMVNLVIKLSGGWIKKKLLLLFMFKKVSFLNSVKKFKQYIQQNLHTIKLTLLSFDKYSRVITTTMNKTIEHLPLKISLC